MSEPAVCDVYVVHEDDVAEVLDGRASDDELAYLGDLFQLLASPARLRIVEALARKELCVCDLSFVAGLSQSAASHHLRQMRQQRIVRWRKDGRRAYYRLDDAHISRLFETGLEHVRE